jgi:hypothetical protein
MFNFVDKKWGHHFSLLYGIRVEDEEEKAWTITLC